MTEYSFAEEMPKASLASQPPAECLWFLIWSNEHRAWWGPNECDYTSVIGRAGRYEFARAAWICENANHHLPAGQEPNEVLVLAPEHLTIDGRVTE